ncbi:MAG: metal-dependent transcriptional regulator [Planctomycetota bacterium]
MTANPISASREDYVEAIYQLAGRDRGVRATDIARRLNVRRASVTGALRTLAGLGLVHYTPYRAVTLTPAGRTLGRQVSRRHAAIREFFEKVLGVAPAKADAAACRVEHCLDADILERLADLAARGRN